MSRINLKRITGVIAVLLISAIAVYVIYTRGCAERQKPFVDIGFPASGSMVWAYETRCTIEAAEGLYAADHNADWTITAHVPLSAYVEYMSDLDFADAAAIADNVAFPEPLRLLERLEADDGGYTFTYSYSSPSREAKGQYVQPGEGVTVRFEVPEGILQFNNLLPSSAVRKDVETGGHFIFTVSQHGGALGSTYVVTRRDVELGLPNMVGDMAHISQLETDIGPIVLWADKELENGDAVRIFD